MNLRKYYNQITDYIPLRKKKAIQLLTLISMYSKQNIEFVSMMKILLSLNQFPNRVNRWIKYAIKARQNGIVLSTIFGNAKFIRKENT